MRDEYRRLWGVLKGDRIFRFILFKRKSEALQIIDDYNEKNHQDLRLYRNKILNKS